MEPPLDLPEVTAAFEYLSPSEFVWFLAWNIADGRWHWTGLQETSARALLLELFHKLQPDRSLGVLEESSGRLQLRLMTFMPGSFEEIQQAAPFSHYARRNMEYLLRAWKNQGDAGFARVWEDAFRPGWEAARAPQPPVRVTGEGGDSEARALEIQGAADGKARVMAEHWYLHHTFRTRWKPGRHFTAGRDTSGGQCSVHEVPATQGGQQWIYFRIPRLAE